jgi:hypothetical protein
MPTLTITVIVPILWSNVVRALGISWEVLDFLPLTPAVFREQNYCWLWRCLVRRIATVGSTSTHRQQPETCTAPKSDDLLDWV